MSKRIDPDRRVVLRDPSQLNPSDPHAPEQAYAIALGLIAGMEQNVSVAEQALKAVRFREVAARLAAQRKQIAKLSAALDILNPARDDDHPSTQETADD